MREGGPDLQAIGARLAQALRREHEAMKANIEAEAGRDQARRVRRRKTIHTSAVSLGVVLALSGTALAAGDALGVIELGRGVSAVQVSSIPVWNGTTGTFITGKSEHGSYFYHLTGGSDPNLTCGPTDPHPTNNIYVTSTHPLAASELKQILDAELSHETKPHAVIMKEVAEGLAGKPANGAKWLRRGRYPMIGGGEDEPHSSHKLVPPGVSSVSNGCPTTGVAGQPGATESSAAAGEAGATGEPSAPDATP